MTKELSPKGPDWFVVCCSILTVLLLGMHSVSVTSRIYSDPTLWPFGILVAVMVMIIYLMCRVIAYEFCGKSDD